MIKKSNVKIWMAIAKKEFRIFTYRFRRNRSIFLILITVLLIFWGFYIGPNLLNSILPENFRVWANQNNKKFGDMFGFFFVIIFFVNFLVPIYDTYRKSQVDLEEMHISSPINIRDILFGEYLWKIPIYLWIILLIGPLFSSIIGLIKILGFFDLMLIYLSLFAVFIISLTMGEMLISVVENYVIDKEKVKKGGSIVIFLATFIIIGLVYLFQFILLALLNNPELNLILLFFPSFWYSNIIIYNIDTTLLLLPEVNFWISIILAFIIPILLLKLYYNRLGKLEFIKETQLDEKLRFAKVNKKFYKLIDRLTITKWKKLVSTKIKIFHREKENIMKILFIISTTILTAIVLLFSFQELQSYLDREYSQFLSFETYRNTTLLTLSWLSSLLFAVLWGIYSFIYSKDIIYIYRRSPRGLRTLIISHIYSQTYIIIFIDIIISILVSVLFLFSAVQFFFFFFIFLGYNINTLLQIIGFQCINPSYKYKKKVVFINIYYILSIQIIFLSISLGIIFPSVPRTSNYVEILNRILQMNMIFSSIITPLILYLGFIKLKKIQ